MIIGNREFKDGTFIMGIINITPDSFWKGSRVTADTLLKIAEKQIGEGADILDIGAQSTRPNYCEVSEDEEIARLEKSILNVKSRFDIPVSVDTYYPKVAKVALSLGADMINDTAGLTFSGMAEVVAEYGGSVCIMHGLNQNSSGNVFERVLSFLKKQADFAQKSGIDKDKIILDGGIGFGKSKEESLSLLNGYEKLSSLGFPTLLGASRKSLFGSDPAKNLKKTLHSTAIAKSKGVLIVRVHDVAENAKILRGEYAD